MSEKTLKPAVSITETWLGQNLIEALSLVESHEYVEVVDSAGQQLFTMSYQHVPLDEEDLR